MTTNDDMIKRLSKKDQEDVHRMVDEELKNHGFKPIYDSLTNEDALKEN